MEKIEEHLNTLDDEEEEIFTPQKVLEAIEAAWLNEKFAPEILPHQSDLVDCMLQQITHMEENMKRLEKGDLRLVVHGLELDRIKFVISSYLRTRLEKIEKYVWHILAQESNKSSEESYLTSSELQFAKDYSASMETLFNNIALQYMPYNLQSFETNKLMIRPNMQTHVFLQAKKDIDGIIIPDNVEEEAVDFETGSQHIIQYNAIADLVKQGAVQLI
ncbi:DNA replication complex GINS protein SLD5-like [Prorops nasuta]|uniref:DNA replication complex GINS protein SLD5 n=1 Tax=Prorops nasuta TaxID=863751 RepID=UPI0034CF2E67